MGWLVAQTYCGCEFRAARQLHANSHGYYLPRFFDAELARPRPLFPRYIFIHDIGDYVFAMLRTIFAVTKVVHFGEEFARVSDAAIDALKARENIHGNIVLPGAHLPPRLRIGDKVVVMSGPFATRTGIYQGQNARNYARVLIEFMNRSSTMVVEHRLLERLAPEGAASSIPAPPKRRRRRSRGRRKYKSTPAHIASVGPQVSA